MSKEQTDELRWYKQFPDSGPEQAEVSRWMEENGGKMGLYDGAVESNVKTNTRANWRWRWADLSSTTDTMEKRDLRVAEPGDYVVKLATGVFVSLTTEQFDELCATLKLGESNE